MKRRRVEFKQTGDRFFVSGKRVSKKEYRRRKRISKTQKFIWIEKRRVKKLPSIKVKKNVRSHYILTVNMNEDTPEYYEKFINKEYKRLRKMYKGIKRSGITLIVNKRFRDEVVKRELNGFMFHHWYSSIILQMKTNIFAEYKVEKARLKQFAGYPMTISKKYFKDHQLRWIIFATIDFYIDFYF